MIRSRAETRRGRKKTASIRWNGVISSVTTPFNADFSVDHGALTEHCKWLADSGVSGILPLGVLGEASTLSHAEQREVLETCMRAVGERLPIIAGIYSLGTPEAVALAKHARSVGCRGLMVIPPLVYGSDWREIRAHMSAVIGATHLPCMLNNDAVIYRSDVLPEQVVTLAREFSNLKAIRETGSDMTRLAELRALFHGRLEILFGRGENALSAIASGATGWVSALASAFPVECVAFHTCATEQRSRDVADLADWLFPLMSLIKSPKIIQLLKLAQEKVGHGSQRVRPPRMPLEGTSLKRAADAICRAIATRPSLDESDFSRKTH